MAGLGYSDAPIASAGEDALGLAPYAAALSDFILRCDTPMTVAIQGDWGTGKTSLMNMVREALISDGSERAIHTIWFATWQYAQFGATQALPVSLLSTLLRKISGDNTSLLASSMNALKKLAKPALNIGLRVATAGSVEADDFTGDANGAVDLACNAEELKEDIAKLVAKKQAEGVQRIVIFVDDLDRVPPARAVDILETIKLFVDLQGCVFVLALDYAVVRRGLREKFGVAENDLGGRSFFDKIIQLPFSIPTARYETDRFIGTLFQRMNLTMKPEDGELFAELARRSVSANPRGIKRVFNSLQLLVSMARTQGVLTGDEAGDRLLIRNLFALLCLQNRFEAIHEWLVFNAERLDEATLKTLDGTVDSDAETDEDLAAAINAFDPEQAAQFAAFSRSFLIAIQDTDGADESFDAQEIERFKRALTLTRVTSVGDEAAPAVRNDGEFRWRNRDLMKGLRDELTDDAVPVKVTQPHSESGAFVYRTIDEGRWYTLSLYHGEASATLSIEASQKRLDMVDERLRTALVDHVPMMDKAQPGVLVLWREKFAEPLEIGPREALLRSEAVPLFRSVITRLAGVLD